MKAMEQKILQEGTVLPGGILKVGSFLNQRIDTEFLRQMDAGKNPEHPVCISVDGSTFQKSIMMQKKLDSYIKSELNTKGFFCDFIKPQNTTLIGAALATVHDQ